MRLYVAQRFSRRRDQLLFGAIALVILVIPAVELVTKWGRIVELTGHDFNLYLDAAARWLGGGYFYPPEELAGPFIDDGNRILYPPSALLLFVPLAAIPRGFAAALWVTFPIAALVWQWVRMRPFPVAWPLLAICVAWPPTLLTFAVWNSGPIFVGFLALGTVYAWPAALNVIKPSVLPFAFWGSWRRSWWFAMLALAVLGIPFGSLWFDWLQVLRMSDVGGIWHSVQEWPMFFWPLLVWLARSEKSIRPLTP